MKIFLEVTKSFWQQLAEESLKRVVATLIAEGVKGGVEVHKEIYKSRQIRKEHELIKQDEALKEFRKDALKKVCKEESKPKAAVKTSTDAKPCKCNCKCGKSENS